MKSYLLSVTLVAAFAGLFWMSTSPAGVPATCTFCHKRTQTMTLPCNSLDYARHLDHGDTIGACAVTPTENP